MAALVVRVGCRSEQGLRSNNEDRFVADAEHGVYIVADGMGGQERGEHASGLAVEIIPKVVQDRLAASDQPDQAVRQAIMGANAAIIEAGQSQAAGRKMGTTAVVAVQQNDCVYVAGVGDSRVYLIRGQAVEQLTVDHSVAQALVTSGALTVEEARNSPWQHVLHRFLGCTAMTECPDVRPFTPQAGDRLLLASDGLTNYIQDEDLRLGARQFLHPQQWADHLVELALKRGTRDNVTCVVVHFESESTDLRQDYAI